MSQLERWTFLVKVVRLTAWRTELRVLRSSFKGEAREHFRTLLFKGYRPAKAEWVVKQWVRRRERG